MKSSQQRTRFTVTDHSSRLQTGNPFLAFQPSAKSDRKRPLSDELHGKNKQTPRNKPTQLMITLSHTQTQTARSGFRLQTNTKFEQSNPHESDEGGKKKNPHLAMAVPFLHSKERLNSRTVLSLLNAQSRVEVIKANRTLETLITIVLSARKCYTDA